MAPKQRHIISPEQIETVRDIALADYGALPAHVRRFGRIPDPQGLLRGDLILFRDRTGGLKPAAIARFQQGRLGYSAQDAAWYHAAVYLGGYEICDAQLSGGVKVRSLYEYVARADWRVRRDAAISPAAHSKIADFALAQVGKPYDVLRVLRLPILPGSRPLVPAWLGRPESSKAQICSTLYTDSYFMATGEALSNVSIITPAELSLAASLEDVKVGWAAVTSSP